ncbi:MAG: flagellin [Alphaproteobacteria bacterium]|nr:flagellin [Alphaproteobacteria bacterium]
MAVSNVSLSSSAKTSLTSLQQTANALQSAQQKLATGKKVNSALDGATAFFASQAFLDRANDLSNVKDGVSTALQTVNAANNGIDAVSKLVDQAKGIATAALQTQDPTARAAFAQQFDDLRSQIDGIVADSSLNGRNLIDGTSSALTVNFNETSTSTLTIANTDLTSTGLGVAASTNAFANDSDINAAFSNLTTASTKLRTTAANISDNATIISTRSDFISNSINTLKEASDNLTLDDINEQAANLLALQVKNSLGISALSISNQAQQNVLKLF